MQAFRIHKYGGPEVLELEEIEAPQPQENEVLLKVAVVGVNYADIMQRQGTYPIPTNLPAIIGNEVAGTVVALGQGVKELPVGSRVIAITTSGAYAEYATAKISTVVPIPPQLDFASATALFAQGLTAYLLLTDAAGLIAGQSVLINSAAGGVGSLLVQLAKLLGAGRVVGTASHQDKLAFINNLGADAAINYTRSDWAEQIRAANGGSGVDVALDAVGGVIGEQTLQAIAPFGKLVVYGAASGQATSYTAPQLSFTNLTLRGFTLPGYTPLQMSQALGQLLNFVLEGKLTLHIGATFPFKEAHKAHEAVGLRNTVGKVVLTLL